MHQGELLWLNVLSETFCSTKPVTVFPKSRGNTWIGHKFSIMKLRFRSRNEQILAILAMIMISLLLFMKIGEKENSNSVCLTDPMDVVYTWVNGSDPDFLASKAKYANDSLDEEVTDNKRFNDLGIFLYSIRSIGMFAPWIRNIYIVTNGQVREKVFVTCVRERCQVVFKQLYILPTLAT